jgi:hypothetical protein
MLLLLEHLHHPTRQVIIRLVSFPFPRVAFAPHCPKQCGVHHGQHQSAGKALHDIHYPAATYASPGTTRLRTHEDG